LRACDLHAFVVVDDPGHVEAKVVDVEPDSKIAADRPEEWSHAGAALPRPSWV